MTTRKKLYIQRFYLALFGIVLSIFTFEIVLRVYVFVLNDHKTYTFNKELVYSMAKEKHEVSSGYQRNDTQEQYSPLTQPKGNIYAIGDSFTNGGNLIYSNSYPYKLFKELNESWNVHNMGVCESTSIDSLGLVDQLLSTPIEDHSLFLILTGATDIFAGHSPDRSTMANPLLKIQQRRVIHQNPKESFLSNFKSYLLFKELLDQLKATQSNSFIKYDLKAVQKLNQIVESPAFKKCSLTHSSGHCLATMIDKEFAQDAQDYILASYLKLDLAMTSLDYSKRIRSLLDFVKLHGDILEDFSWVDISATLTFLSSKQSQYALQSILLELESLFKTFQHKKDHLFYQAIDNLKEAVKDREKLLQNRKERITSLVNKVRSKEMIPILMTYPLPYSEVNKTIREIALNHKLHFIDLEKIFSLESVKAKKQLLVDYQHLTPEGNSLMAKSIQKYIQAHSPFKSTFQSSQ